MAVPRVDITTNLEGFYAESTMREETTYEILSPKLTEECEREIPIFVDGRDHRLLPSQLPTDAEEVEVN